MRSCHQIVRSISVEVDPGVCVLWMAVSGVQQSSGRLQHLVGDPGVDVGYES